MDLNVDVRITHVICTQTYKKLNEYIDFCKEYLPRIFMQEHIEPFTFLYLQSPLRIETASKEEVQWIKNMMPRFPDSSPFIYDALKKLKRNAN